jgi:hypothetical protein
MKRFLMLALAVGLLGVAAVWSVARPDRSSDAAGVGRFDVQIDEKKNPWTGLTPNWSPDQFQFAVVADRTGGHRKGVFSKAVQQINLMHPEFVMSVGDLIEGNANNADVNRKQWDEFDGYARQFKMPFFYCPGNHDAQSLVKQDVWAERLGRKYYHFGYKNCLFVVLNDMDYEADDPKDPPKQTRGLRVGKRQREMLAEALKKYPTAAHTFLFLHHPVWAQRDLTETGWLDVENLLKGRKYTMFCGHVHTYRKYVRNGMNYYQLATTGGGSALRGPEYGEFDQIGWVTVTKDGPTLANVLIGGVLKDDLQPFTSDEDGGEPGRDKLPGVVGTVAWKGKPAAGWQVVFTQLSGDPDEPATTGNAKVTADGTFAVYGTRGGPGLKAGKYYVTFEPAVPLVVDMKATPAENTVPEKYRKLRTTPLSVMVKDGETNRFDFKVDE